MGSRLAGLAAVVLGMSVAASGAGVKVSERFGFNAEDSTEFLQAAFDSGLPEIVIDAKDTPWVTRPLFLRSNQKIVFEKGVVLLAKRREFRQRLDCLVTMDGCRNVEIVGNGAVLRMWREDYVYGRDRRGRRYIRSEWRHALAIRGSQQVTIDGLVLEDSGGDGLIISKGRGKDSPLPKDIVIRNCVCDRNHRQGLSIISGINVLVENCVFKNTKGTPPQNGVDVEPDHKDHHCINVVLRNCLSQNNAGKGFEAALSRLRAGTPVSIRFENCRSVGDKWGVKVRTKVKPSDGDYPTGSVVYDRCTFERTEYEAITVQQVPKQAFEVRFDNCRFERIGEKNRKTPLVRFASVFAGDPQPALPTFTGLVWPDRGNRALFEYDDMNFAERGEKTLPLRKVNLKSARVVDRSKGKFIDLAPMAVVDDSRYYVYADGAGDVRLAAKQIQVGSESPVTGKVEVVSAAGRKVASLEMPGFEGKELVFKAPAAGFYRISFMAGKNAIALTGTDAPVALDTTRNRRYGSHKRQIVGIHDANGTFYVPMRAGERAEFRSGGSVAGMFNEVDRPVVMAVVDPAGRTMFADDEVITVRRFTTEPAKEEGVWELRLRSPLGGKSFHELAGASPLLFLTREKFWYTAR